MKFFCTVIATAVLLLGHAGATERNGRTRAFLAASFGVTGADLARVDRGEVVSGTLAITDKREVATFGIVRVRVPPEFYALRVADIATFKKTDGIVQIGTFTNPPGLTDVTALTLDEEDLDSLQSCRVGHCDMQLPAAAIGRFQREVDWHRAGAEQRANGVMREMLVEYVGAYMTGGTAASMEYADRPQPLNLRSEFASLTATTSGGWQAFPTLQRHLTRYPLVDLPPIDDVIYWSKEDVGRRTVTSVTHLAISRGADESGADYAIASKQIYGSHYYEASLGLTMLFRDDTASSPALYLAYANRSRLDLFSGLFGGVARRIVTSRARATVSAQLARLQRRLEADFLSAKGS